MRTLVIATVIASVTLIASCGGGGGGDLSNSLSGTVAVGAPIRGATVEVFNSLGNQVAQAQTGVDGKYTVQLPNGAQGPFVIKASYADEALYSVHTGQGNVANVSHLTDAVTAILSPTGAADGLADSLTRLSSLDSQQVEQAVNRLRVALTPVSSLISDLPPGASFMNSAFDANGTGIDRLLDAAGVTVTAKQVNDTAATNIAITFNVTQGFNELNSSRYFAFDSSESIANINSKASALTFNPIDLPPVTLGQLYLNLIDRLNACYAIPLAQRVSGDSIVSQACRDVFYNADPSLYLDGGFNVRQRFSSLFTATGVIRFTSTQAPIISQDLFGAGSSGRALVAAKGEDELGNYLYNRFYVRIFTRNGREMLGIEGDQNPFEFYVNSENEHRTFPLSSIDLDHVQSQFALILRVPASMQAPVTAAIVEGPSGRFQLAPRAGRDNFRVCRQIPTSESLPTSITTRPDCSGVPLLVYASSFLDEQISRPRNVQTPLDFDHIQRDFFVVRDENGQLLADSAIERIPTGGLWKATVFFNDGTSRVLFTHNTGRPMTSTELRGADSPIYRASQLTKLTLSEGSGRNPRVVDFSETAPVNPNAGIPGRADRQTDPERRFADRRTPVWAPLDDGFQFEWDVSNKRIPPFLIFLSGQVRINWDGLDVSVNRQAFEDFRRVSVVSRTAKVFCSPSDTSSLIDQSCDTALVNGTLAYLRDAANNYVYNPGSSMTSSSLISRDQNQRSIIRGYNWFIPTNTREGSTVFFE